MTKEKSNFRKRTGQVGKSIRTKLLILLLFISVIPLLILGYSSYRTSYNTLYQRLRISSLQNIQQIQNSIDNSFGRFEAIINLFSEDQIFKDIYSNKELTEEVFNRLGYAQKSDSSILGAYIGLEDKQTILYPRTELESDYDPRERDWYKQAMGKKGELVYSDPYIDAFTGKTIITLSKTVEEGDKTIGALAIDVALDELASILSSIKVGKNGFLHIIDSKGITVSHPKAEELGKKTDEDLLWWEDVSKAKTGFESYSTNGNSVYIGHNTDEKRDWKIIANLSERELLDDTNKLRLMIGVMSVVGVIASVALGSLLVNWINKNIKKLLDAFEKTSKGDLLSYADIKTGDEFEELSNGFNNMVNTIRGLVININNSSDTLLRTADGVSSSADEASIAVDEISITMDQLAQGTVSQAQDISEGVNIVNSLGQEIESINKLVINMNEISYETNKLSKNGLEHMKDLIAKTEEANKSSEIMGEVIQDMDFATEEIGTITDSINNIASQTNLLALNAAIEAARAGEAGRGFSVVADEIRKLAEESNDATDKIQELILRVRDKSRFAVEAMNTSTLITREQTESVKETREVFNNILNSILDLIKYIEEIRDLITETNNNKEDIVSKMLNISSVAQEGSASTEEVSAASEEINATMTEFKEAAYRLKDVSKELKEKLNIFTV